MIELKEIVGYLPYGLKIKWSLSSSEFTGIKDYADKTIFLNRFRDKFQREHTLPKSYPLSECKPILRPLSQLTEEITHNGERFVPIKKIFKECAGLTPRKKYKDDNLRAYKGDNGSGCVGIFRKGKDVSLVLELYWDGMVICYRTVRGKPYVACNQLKIFQYLYEWHFDIHGLIKRGDAAILESK